ncbi:MAG: tetratricopeptide repeat protein [Pseudomonadota bacterium]
MKKRPAVAIAIATLLVGLTACSGSYRDQIQGSYGSSFKRGGEAMRAKDYDDAAEHYAFAAKSGHPRALIAYGRLHAKGQGVERDPVRAAALFHEAHNKASSYKPKAALELGLLYLRGGDGPSGTVNKAEGRARKFLTEALNGGEFKAASSLGRIYDQGLGVDRDTAKAINFYNRAPNTDAYAARRLATLLTRSGASKDDVADTTERVVTQLEARGESGDGKAWLQLADIFSRNQIVDADPARAIAYLERLPEDGDPKMNMQLARLYGQIGDHRERKRRLRLAADAGELKAQTALAKLFLKPGTVDTNGAVGRYYAERAIGKQSKEAMVYLGLALVRGDVLRREPLAGESLLRRAADDGHTGAAVALGASILSGDVRERQPGEGQALLEKAAEKGSADAMSALGFAYQLGRGVPADPAMALEWLQKAADAGQRDAKAFLERRAGTGA